MLDNSLGSLLKVRRIALENAQRRLAECLAVERETTSLLQNGKNSLASEPRVMTLGEAGCLDLDATSFWFKAARAEIVHIRVAHDRMAAECSLARAEVAGAQGAYEASLLLINRKGRDSGERRGRSEQILLDAAVHWRILAERGHAT